MRDLQQKIGHLRAQQASAWVSALAHPDTDRRQEFVEWLKESPANVREFLVAYSIECSLNQLDPQHRIDVDALVAQANPRVTSLPGVDQAARPPQAPRRRVMYKIAAMIAALGAITWLVLFQQHTAWKEFDTETGEQRALQLEDGSVVHLNAHSRIAVSFTAKARDIKLLEGEALFEVHHESERPFRVFTRAAVIRDIGTRFNVQSRADEVKVAVIEGSVELTTLPTGAFGATSSTASQSALASSAASHIIIAAQQAQVDRNGVVTVDAVPDISEATAWWQRRLVYRNERLERIVEDFNRYNRRRIELRGIEVMKRSYTGVFDADDPDSLAQVLASDPELIVERPADDTIIIRAR